MYKIIKDGTTLGMTEAPNYIKLLENGCFALCPVEEAQGVAHAGTAYHLLGRPAMGDAESVMLEEVDAGAEIKDAQGAIDELVVASLGADAVMGDMQSIIDDLVIASLEGGASNV